MLFFGFYFLFAKTPEKKIFKNYLRSRQIMGIAMLLLSANYSVHFFFGIRFKNADSAILMNMSTYFLCYSLFSSALIMLLDRFYITKRRVWTHIILWIIFSTLSGVVLFLLPSGIMQKFSLFALAVWLVVFGVVLARRVIIAYRRAIRIFNETQADDIGTYIEWLSIFTYWAVIFGVGCGLLTFLPDKYVFIWILSSIPFYSYLFYSYQNYLLFYEQVENAFEQDIQSEEELLTDTETEIVSEKEVPVSYTEIIEKVANWIKTDGYVQQGLTIKELSEILHTNRTYLSAYIKTTY
ncbi:AraC family transcriptional regulator, partial [Alistipes putredinis]